MTKKTYDIAVKVGSYEKDGETKGKYKNVGAILKGDDGSFILLDRSFNPAGVPNTDDKETVLLSLFTPKKKEEKADDGQGSI